MNSLNIEIIAVVTARSKAFGRQLIMQHVVKNTPHTKENIYKHIEYKMQGCSKMNSAFHLTFLEPSSLPESKHL